MVPDFKQLNRFTTLPFVTDLLKRRKLALLDPRSWEDYNDRETMEIYRSSIKAESIYALCFTYGNETIHHWNAFSAGTGGCCIEFSPERLFAVLEKDNRIKHGKMEYVSLPGLSQVNPEMLPFVKRRPYSPEKEYRIIATSGSAQQAALDIEIDINIIRRITISGKIHDTVFKSIKESLRQVAPDYKGKIYHSTLYSNPVWINHFRKKLS